MSSAKGDQIPPEDAVKRRIREAAERANAEAQARRQAAQQRTKPGPKEIDGRGGLDPVRHGDWEVNGVASDF